uniref:Uncharacterized protein n=1 Tax=Anguilla anguilla TaxID=7936 RepID=A0A0E9WRR8_ANGAN
MISVFSCSVLLQIDIGFSLVHSRKTKEMLFLCKWEDQLACLGLCN